MTQATYDELLTERNIWRDRCQGMLEVINAVEALFEIPRTTGADWPQAYMALMHEFTAFRMLTAKGIPFEWTVTPDPDAVAVEVDPEEDVPF